MSNHFLSGDTEQDNAIIKAWWKEYPKTFVYDYFNPRFPQKVRIGNNSFSTSTKQPRLTIQVEKAIRNIGSNIRAIFRYKNKSWSYTYGKDWKSIYEVESMAQKVNEFIKFNRDEIIPNDLLRLAPNGSVENLYLVDNLFSQAIQRKIKIGLNPRSIDSYKQKYKSLNLIHDKDVREIDQAFINNNCDKIKATNFFIVQLVNNEAVEQGLRDIPRIKKPMTNKNEVKHRTTIYDALVRDGKETRICKETLKPYIDELASLNQKTAILILLSLLIPKFRIGAIAELKANEIKKRTFDSQTIYFIKKQDKQKGEKEAYITPWIVDILKQCQSEAKAKDDEPIFLKGFKDRKSLLSAITNNKNKNNLWKDVNIHGSRGLFVQFAIQNGLLEEEAQRLIGHTTNLSEADLAYRRDSANTNQETMDKWFNIFKDIIPSNLLKI